MAKRPTPTRDNYDRYLTTYSGSRLTDKMLEEVAVWHVRGEDTNCGMDGPHYQATLGYFHGKLADVIRHAVDLKGFWAWGAGGDFTKINVVELDEAKKREARRAELEARKAEIEAELNELA